MIRKRNHRPPKNSEPSRSTISPPVETHWLAPPLSSKENDLRNGDGHMTNDPTPTKNGGGEIVTVGKVDVSGNQMPGRWLGYDAADAVVLDTSGYTLEQSVEAILSLVRRKLG